MPRHILIKLASQRWQQRTHAAQNNSLILTMEREQIQKKTASQESSTSVQMKGSQCQIWRLHKGLRRSHYKAQSTFEFVVLLYPYECWDCKSALLYPGSFISVNKCVQVRVHATVHMWKSGQLCRVSFLH